jgi:hypothetical protein
MIESFSNPSRDHQVFDDRIEQFDELEGHDCGSGTRRFPKTTMPAAAPRARNSAVIEVSSARASLIGMTSVGVILEGMTLTIRPSTTCPTTCTS